MSEHRPDPATWLACAFLACFVAAVVAVGLLSLFVDFGPVTRP